MKRNLFFILIIAALALGACGARAAEAPQSTVPAVGGAPESYAPVAPAQDKSTTNSVNTTGGPRQERIVIQNADLALVVKDPEAKMREIGAMAERLGGYVVSSNMGKIPVGSSNLEVSQGSISLRIPAKELETALAEIKTGVVEIQSENRSGQDVTDQYVDLQSQLKAKQAAADQLYAILKTATTAEDTLLIFNQLTQVQSEIEVLKGQINYYEQAAALSAVNVRLIAEETVQPLEIGGWQLQGEVRDAVQALIGFFQGFVKFLIWLVIVILPIAAILILLLALLWRLFRWFWKKVFPGKKPTPPAAPAAG